MGFNSLEEGKILASLYYLRRVNEEVERMKASGDPATYFEGEDFYSLIGVEKDAEFSSMRKAYRKKISELHPDRHADSDEETRTTAEDNAKSLNRAYNTLKRSQERRLYDIAMGFCKY
jgi:DnaJ-domain-containing protein 1